MKVLQLNIAELVVSREPAVVGTVLGSCVSVGLFVEGGVGGLIHFALPKLDRGARHDTTGVEALRYGNSAVNSLVDEIARANGGLMGVKAKIAGGAFCLGETHSPTGIGMQNVKVAEEILARFNIPIVARHVGGDLGRKIFFYTSTGRLRVSLLGSSRAA